MLFNSLKKTVIVPLLFFFSYSSIAQDILKGKVIDAETGEGIPDATVRRVSDEYSVATDRSGTFSIKLPIHSKLEVTHISYAPATITVDSYANFIVKLSPLENELNEVVVTALGIKKEKRALGYATQEVNTDALAQSKTSNLGNALSGQVAGLSVNNFTGIFQAPSFVLRGRKPLIVVNGVPVESDFFDMNSADIENINVLKGLTASALYGSKGINGAIMITTKNARKKGFEISVNNRTIVSAGYTVFPQTQTQYGNGSEGKYEFWDGADGGISDGDMMWGPKFGTGIKVAQWNSPIRNKATGEIIPWWGDVVGSIYNDKSKYERVPTDWKYHNNLKDFMQAGIITENTISISNKTDKGQYYLSLNQGYQRGQVPNTALHTGGLTFNSVYQLAKNLEFSANLSYNKVYSPNYPRYGYGPKNHMYTILIWMGDDVDGKDLKAHPYRPDMQGFRQANFNYAWYNNVYFAANELTQKHDRDVVNAQLKLNYQLAKDFSVQGRINGRNNQLYEDMQSPKSYLNYGDSRNGDFKNWNTKKFVFDGDVMATYKKQISDMFGISTMVGTASSSYKHRSNYQSTDGLIQPELYSIGNTAGPVMAKSEINEYAIRSVFGQIDIDLAKAVYLNAAGRKEWHSAIPEKPYFYPSASLSVILSELIQMPQFVNLVKTRASWANVKGALEPYSLAAVYKKDITFGTLPSVSYPASLVNKNIEPYNSNQIEFGVAATMGRGRLNFDVTYYNIKDANQIIDLPISLASGFNTRKENGNEITTNGFEVVLSGKPIATQNVVWTSTLNWSRFVKRLTKIYNDQRKFGNLVKNDRTDSYYALDWEKSADGQLILGENGFPVRSSFYKNLGHTEPDWRLGFLNSVKYKNIVIDVDIDGQWGGIMRSITHEKMWWGGKHPESVEFRDAEYAAGKPVYTPKGVVVTGGEVKKDVDGKIISDTRTYRTNNKAVSWQAWSQNYPYRAAVTEAENKKFANIFDRSFFKLRRLSVGYDFSKMIHSNTISGLSVAAFGYNLLMWKKMPYLDPDFGNDDNLQDPSTRYVGVSINVKF